MAAPKGASYTPKSGPLAGRTFVGTPGSSQAYNRYQAARSRALGFGNYTQERAARQSPRFKQLIGQEKAAGNLTVQKRTSLLRAFGERQRIETVEDPTTGKVRRRFSLDVDFSDRSRGGSYDIYLRAIGRRTGNEDWNPGETP